MHVPTATLNNYNKHNGDDGDKAGQEDVARTVNGNIPVVIDSNDKMVPASMMTTITMRRSG